MGTPLGPKCIPYTYMDPLGSRFRTKGSASSGLTLQACYKRLGLNIRYYIGQTLIFTIYLYIYLCSHYGTLSSLTATQKEGLAVNVRA